MEVLRPLLLAGAAICGFAIVVMSFMDWVAFEAFTSLPAPGNTVSVQISGENTSIWRDDESIDEHVQAPSGRGWCTCEAGFGDGYITAALGLLIVLSAAVGAFTIFGGWAVIAGTVASLATLVIAGFNAFADWSALISINDNGTTVASEGEVQSALYGILVAAALATVLSATARVVDRANDYDEEYDYEDEFDDEESVTGGDSWVSV